MLGENVSRSVYQFYRDYPYPLVYPFSKRHKQLMRKFVHLWGFRSEEELEGLSILDAGCGTGEKSIYFASLGADVTAVDVNDAQLHRAQLLAEKHKTRVEFRRADILTLDLKRKFDLVLCSGVLHHTPDPHQGFARIAGHLKPQGRILIGLYNKYSRVHYSVIRWGLHTLCGNSPERIMDFVNNSPAGFLLRGRASQQTLYDRYAVPYESSHTLSEVRNLFREHGIEVMHISPERIMNSDLISQALWFFNRKSFFFVSGRKQ